MRQRFTVVVAFALGAAVAALVLVIERRPLELIWGTLRLESPHQLYARSLVAGGLANTALGTEWLAAATRAVQHAVTVALPFTEEALVDPSRPTSLGYAVTLKRGQRLDVSVTVGTDTPSRVFVDLFEATGSENSRPRPVASAGADGRTLSYEPDRSGVYALRVQPEVEPGSSSG